MKQAESWDMWNTILDSQSHHLPYPAHLRVPVESQHVQGVVFYILPEQRALPTGSYMYQTSGRETSTNYGLIHMCVCVLYISAFFLICSKKMDPSKIYMCRKSLNNQIHGIWIPLCGWCLSWESHWFRRGTWKTTKNTQNSDDEQLTSN